MLKNLFRTASAGAVIACLVLSTPADADAQNRIYIEGSTLGCFGVGCVPTTTDSFNPDGGDPEMVFRFGDFEGFSSTSMGFFGIGGGCAPVDGPPGPEDNLGCLFLADGVLAPFTVNTPFTLAVNFTAPTITGGDNLFQALISGEVTGSDEGGVFVDFLDNSPRLFTFIGATGDVSSGSFTFQIDDTSIAPNETVPLTGRILVQGAQVVPEPATALLLGTGLLGLMGMGLVRRRETDEPFTGE
jgi:hypothetical protein